VVVSDGPHRLNPSLTAPPGFSYNHAQISAARVRASSGFQPPLTQPQPDLILRGTEQRHLHSEAPSGLGLNFSTGLSEDLSLL